MITWPDDGEDLIDTNICECLMGNRMTGFRAVAVTPQLRCNLPTDFEIGATGWKWKQCHSSDQFTRASISVIAHRPWGISAALLSATHVRKTCRICS